MSGLSHLAIVQRAGKWLKSTRGCGVVLLEQPHSYSSEIPDAIGWRPGACIVVEAKISLSDLRADRRKLHAQNGESMGDERWYMAPPGIIKPDQVPHGSGLLEVYPKTVRIVVRAPHRDITWKRLRAECEYLRVEIATGWQSNPDALESPSPHSEPPAEPGKR